MEFRKKGFRFLSLLITCILLLQLVPVTGQFTASAKEQQTTQKEKGSNEHAKKEDRQELIEKRTENSKTFSNDDGTLTTEVSQKPIHYKNKHNNWEEIDNKLVENKSEQVFENKANAFKVKFDEQIANDPFLEVKDKQGSVQLQIEPLEHSNEKPATVKGEVDGEVITYPEVFPNVDMKYTVGSDRIKEDIIYNEKPKDGFPNQFTFKIDTNGMDVKEVDGTIFLYDKKTEQKLYYFESPYMYDSYKPKDFKSISQIKSIPEEAISYDIKLKYEMINNELFLNVVPNKEWLEDSNRVYPITIDPTLVKLQSDSYVVDTNLRSGFPTQTGGNDIELGGGRSGTNVIRSLLKFDLSSIPAATSITSANLNLWFSSTNSNSPIDISLHKVTKAWEENQANWNSAKTSTPWSLKGGDFVNTPLSTISGITEPGDLITGQMSWSIPPALVSNWITNPSSNYGFLLKSDTETVTTYKKFISSEHSIDEQYHPLLVITYNTAARLGLEDYWLYDSNSLVDGNNYVNLSTGNNIIQYEDYNLMSRGDYGLDFKRTYNAKSLEKSIFGYGWTATGLENLFIKGNQNMIDYTDEDGTTHTFSFDATDGLYKSAQGLYLSIKKFSKVSSGKYEYFYEMLDKYGEKTVFKIRKMDYSTDTQIANLEYKEDRHGNRINFLYENEKLIKISSPLTNNLEKSINFTYNAQGFVESADYDGDTFKFFYDSEGKVTKMSHLGNDGKYKDTGFEYTNNRISAIVDSNNRRTDFVYEKDKNEMLSKVQLPDVDSNIDGQDRPGTKYVFDTLNKKTSVLEPNGSETLYYATENYVINKIIADGIETNYTLDSNYNVLTENTEEMITSNTYDTNGNILSTIEPNGNTWKYNYTNYSNVKDVTDPLGRKTTYTYNVKGDLEKIEEPDVNSHENLITKLTYDEYGDILSAVNPDGSTQSTTIDYTNKIKTINNIDPLGNSTTIKTDFKGNVLEKKDGKTNVSSYIFNTQNLLNQVKDPKLNVTKYGYDKSGNVNTILNARNFESSFSYNNQNQLKEEINEIGNKTLYDYDSNGNLISILLPNENTISKKYNELNQLTEVYNNGTLQWKYSYEDDKLQSINRLDSLAKSYNYYENGLVKTILERNNLIEYSYNDEDYISKIEYKIGDSLPTQINYVPLETNQTKEITRNGKLIVSFNYYGELINKISYANGSSISMQYDDSRLSEYVIKRNNSQYENYKFEYDANQNINKIISNAGVTEYDYDQLNQLQQEKLPNGMVSTFKYDEVGNRTEKKTTIAGKNTSTIYKYNGANQLTQVNDKKYQYDKNGNLVSDGDNNYVFNDFNQLEAIKDSNGKVLVTYTYDEEGKRNSVITSEGTINYFYDGDRVLYETNGDNQVLREYSYDDKGRPISMTKGDSTFYYLFNYRGDVVALTDTNGHEVASYTYDAWGNILSESGEISDENPYRYAGYRYDELTKLYYLKARYYNPENGVFLAHDPIRGELNNPISQNGYNYGNNNPVMYIDSTGTAVETVLDLASLGYSIYQFVKNPTWKTAGYLIWDIAAAAIPVVPGSYVYKGGKLLVYLKKGGEVVLPGVKSFEVARNIAFKILEKEGNAKLSKSKPSYGRLPKSYAYNKVQGRKDINGNWEWRVDWDDKKGYHINIIIGKKKPYKIAIPFKCTQKQYKAIIDSYNKKR